MKIEKKKQLTKKNKLITPKNKIASSSIVPDYDQYKVVRKWNKANTIMVLSIVLVVLSSLFALYYFFVLPSIKLNGSYKTEIIYPNTYKEEGVILERFGKKINKDIKISGNVDSTKLGKYTIKYTYKGLLISKTAKRIVTVIDNEKPVITLKGKLETNSCPGRDYKEEGYTVTDNYDKDLSSSVKIDKTDSGFTYSVTDSGNNSFSISRKVNYVDKEAPVITLKGGNTVYQLVGTDYKEEGYTAIDECEGDYTSSISVSGTVNKDVVGTYILTYSVTDKQGNTAKVTRRVIVTKSINKEIGKAGVVYLTFDDGPDNNSTARILDVLKKYNVKATFFVTMNGSDALIKREYEEGHTVGLHTASHNYKTCYTSAESYFNDLSIVSNRVKRITGLDSKIIRFPGGSSNTISRRYNKGIMTYLAKEVINRGYRYYDWNISSGDAGDTKDPKKIVSNINKYLSKDKANMILMHDVKSYTADAIEDVIKSIMAKGYTFEAIDMNTSMVKQAINN
ncbi:MAG: polysaccharide deacetylase family protein [Bacilli bacterium]